LLAEEYIGEGLLAGELALEAGCVGVRDVVGEHVLVAPGGFHGRGGAVETFNHAADLRFLVRMTAKARAPAPSMVRATRRMRASIESGGFSPVSGRVPGRTSPPVPSGSSLMSVKRPAMERSVGMDSAGAAG